MFLSKTSILDAVNSERMIIEGFNPENLKDASYSFSLDNWLKNPYTNEEISFDDRGFLLKKGDFVIVRTFEKLDLKHNFICLLSGRRKIANLGIDTLQSDYVCEPDTNNKITLAITNHSQNDVLLFPKMLIIKGLFSRVI